MIKAVIFDFDGTLLDTETCSYDAFCKMYSDYGHELPLEQWALCIGTVNGPFDPYTELEIRVGGPLDRAMLKAGFESDYLERVDCAELRPGVIDTLEEVRRLGLRIGLASSSHRAWIDKHLEAMGIRKYFESIHTSDDVEKVKPHPALYRLALASLGVRAEEAVAVEDSLHGMNAAKAAGMHAIIVPNPVTLHMDFTGAGADLIIESLAAQPFKDLLDRLGTAE
jgi:putative hydrolase of the HAD superfamily